MLLALLFFYKPEVEGLLRRLREAEILGQRAKFDKALDQLEKQAEEAEEAPLPEIPRPETPSPAETIDDEQPSEPTRAPPMPARSRDDSFERVLSEASTSPRLGLVALSAELERRFRRILAASQPPTNWERRALPTMVERVELDASLKLAIQQFYDIRSRIVHGHRVDDNDAVRALDSGLKLLAAVSAIPYERHVVRGMSDVFADERGDVRRTMIRAVILDNVRGEEIRRQVFPTPLTYDPGTELSWEWREDSRGWGESWYLDPDSEAIEYAWTSSLEFVGRDVDSI